MSSETQEERAAAGAEFDRDIAVTPAGAVEPGTGGTFAGSLSDGWRVGGGLNGGYQLAVLGNAVRAALPDHPDPIAVSAYYLSPATAGAAEGVVEVRRGGGRTATVAADLRQAGETRLTLLATYGDLARFPTDDVRTTAEPLRLPPVDQCVPGSLAPPEVREMAPFIERFDMRFHPDDVGWAVGSPSGRGRLRAWFRFPDGREPDPLALLMAVDALPPVTFDLGLPGWAPTVELTVHVRARPAPGWLRLHHATRNVAGGMFEEDCEVWDSSDRLVAQSRQLARLPR